MTRFILFLFVSVFLSACAGKKEEDAPLYIRAVGFPALPGWGQDDLTQTARALSRSCARVEKKDGTLAIKPALYLDETTEKPLVYGDMAAACQAMAALPASDNSALRSFFARWFLPYEVRAGKETEGLFTGYYEAALNGAAAPKGPYQHPLLKRPDDLVMVDLGAFREDLKGRRIAGRVVGAYLKPYEDRAEIERGALNEEELALVWVNNPVDAFFLHIQGSGRVNLDNGEVMRVGYDGQNGHPYYAIGRELIKRGYIEKDEVSMQSIRAFLEQNPNKAQDIMNTNKSYIFFRMLDADGPLGGEGVALTAGRSMAVDHTKIPYGLPLWVDLEPPTENNDEKIRRLMVAQDTGGAIRGAVRGDVFWGHGERAEYLAGHMKSKGRYWILLPKQNENYTGL